MEPEKTPPEKEEKIYTVKEFFEDVLPGQIVKINDLAEKTGDYVGSNDFLLPELVLHCKSDSCNGFRLFRNTTSHELTAETTKDLFVHFQCKNCSEEKKKYAILAYLGKDRKNGFLYKYGESPEFGPPTPSKVVSILGDEKEYYFKGRRSENQGLGIAAFGYYRRVVEHQKNKIFDEIIRTVQKVEPTNSALLAELQEAKKEIQFSKAVDSIKQGIPQTLLIDGHNPLTLLHSALSDGLHAKTDEECLEFATSIRVVLTDLVERMSNAVKDTAELKSALSKLLQHKSNPKK